MKHPLPKSSVQPRSENTSIASPQLQGYEAVLTYPTAAPTPSQGTLQRFDKEDERGLETIFKSKEFQPYYRFDPEATKKGALVNMASDKALKAKQHFNILAGKDKGGKESASSSAFTEDRKDETLSLGRKLLSKIPFVGTLANLYDAEKAKKQARANLLIVSNTDNPFIRNIALGQLLNLMEERRAQHIAAGISLIPFGDLISDVMPHSEEVLRKLGEMATEQVAEYSAETGVEKAVGIPRPALEAQLAASKQEIAYHELLAFDPNASEALVYYLERETQRDRNQGQSMEAMSSPSANATSVASSDQEAINQRQKLSLAEQVGEYRALYETYLANEDQALTPDGINQVISTLATYMAQATRLSLKSGQSMEMSSLHEEKGKAQATEQLKSMFEKEMQRVYMAAATRPTVMPIWQAQSEAEENECL